MGIRIVGGTWGGRTLEAPEGRGTTRPTTERTRESMASMVLSAFDLDLSGVRVLDAFAGSGAVGFELLSRGARSCLFCDRDRKAAARIRRNAAALGATREQCRVITGDVCQLARRAPLAGGPFSLVVLDPPYAMRAEAVARLISDLDGQGSLEPGARILYERSSEAAALEGERLRAIKHKSHGITSVDLLRLEG